MSENATNLEPNTRLLKPGYLVSIQTKIEGGVHYSKTGIEIKSTDGVDEVKEWNTTKVIDDKELHKLAERSRNQAADRIKSICSPTGFGYLCPTDRKKELDVRIAEARKICESFNATQSLFRISCNALAGRLAESEEEATRSLAFEIRGMLEAMEQGIKNVDVEGIRTAAKKAKKLGQMLDESQTERVNAAVEAARKAASTIVKRVEKEGEDAETVITELKTEDLTSARFAFLDMEHGDDDEDSEVPVQAAQRFADVADEEI